MCPSVSGLFHGCHVLKVRQCGAQVSITTFLSSLNNTRWMFVLHFADLLILDGHWGCFHFLALVSSAVLRGCKYVFETLLSIPLGTYPEWDFWIM